MPAAIEDSVKCIDLTTTKRINAICNNFLSFPVATENVIMFSINTSDSTNVFSLFQMAQDLRPEERVEIVCYICAKVFFVCFCFCLCVTSVLRCATGWQT